MRKIAGGAILLLLFQLTILSQTETPTEAVFKRVELLSPWIIKDGRSRGPDPLRRDKNCFDLIRLEVVCRGPQPLGYGNRIGDNWDIFATDGGGLESRTRMIELGKYGWKDTFSIPEIEPWSELKPGEQRHIMINASGRDGAPGRNADGGYATAPGQRPIKKPKQSVAYADSPLTRQVTSNITMSGKSVRGDCYVPFFEVKLGHMYLVRVVNRDNDHYILIRVEELVRGEKVVFSYFRFPSVSIP